MGSAKAPGAGYDDPPIIGIARPANLSDPYLTNWVKDTANPIVILNGSAALATDYSGPSNVWLGADGAYNLVMTSDDVTGRFTSTDPALHEWALAEPYPFYPEV